MLFRRLAEPALRMKTPGHQPHVGQCVIELPAFLHIHSVLPACLGNCVGSNQFPDGAMVKNVHLMWNFKDAQAGTCQ